MSFEELYKTILNQQLGKEASHPDCQSEPDFDPYHLDCLLHPEKYAPVLATEACGADDCHHACQESCIFDAIVPGPDGRLMIDPEYCTG